MFVVLLKFADKSKAGPLLEGHKAWLKQGFDEGVFLLGGSLQPDLGGAILVHNTSLPELKGRVDSDPFVANGVVTPEILEIKPSRFDDRLKFLAA